MGRVTVLQKSKLIELIHENQDILLRRTTAEGRKVQERKWEEIAQEVNRIGVVQRDGKAWKKTFSDMRTCLKKKLNALRGDRQRTGGGEGCIDELTPDEMILESLMGAAGDGHSSVGELGDRRFTNVAFARIQQRNDECNSYSTAESPQNIISASSHLSPILLTITPPPNTTSLVAFSSFTPVEVSSDLYENSRGPSMCETFRPSQQSVIVNAASATLPDSLAPDHLTASETPPNLFLSESTRTAENAEIPCSSTSVDLANQGQSPGSTSLSASTRQRIRFNHRDTFSTRQRSTGRPPRALSSNRHRDVGNTSREPMSATERSRRQGETMRTQNSHSNTRHRSLSLSAVERNLEMANTTNELLRRFVVSHEIFVANHERFVEDHTQQTRTFNEVMTEILNIVRTNFQNPN